MWLIRLVVTVNRFVLRFLVSKVFADYRDKKLVVLESPFAGDENTNIDYARRCAHDCFVRGELPFASHLLYTQHGILNDKVPEERNLGIHAGLIWTLIADKTVVYEDYGISKGMEKGIAFAKKLGRSVEYRKI